MASGPAIQSYLGDRSASYSVGPIDQGTNSSSPTPSIKIATNTPLFERMEEDMDVDAGRILTGGASVADVGREIFELILEVASGRKTKSELHGYGQSEFVPWQLGAVM